MRTAQVGDIYLNAMTHWGPLRKNPALLPPQPKNRIMKARLGPGVKGGNQFLSSFAFEGLFKYLIFFFNFFDLIHNT